MKKRVTTALALSILLGSLGAGTGQADTRPLHLEAVAMKPANRGPCDEERWLRITPKEAHTHPHLVDGLIRCVSSWRSVPGGYAAFECIGDHESSDWPWAVGGPNYGVFQISSWTERAKTYLRSRWFNDSQWDRITANYRGAFIARANVILADVWAHQAWSWSAWSTAGRCGE